MDDVLVTEEARQLEVFINDHFPHFTTELEVRLRTLFPEPENKGLAHIWRYGAADLVVRKKSGKIVAIFEPGGCHHFEERQSLNDRRKYMLCKVNGVKCCSMMNSVLDALSNRQLRKLVGSYLYGPRKE